MTAGLPGLTRMDHVGFTVPDMAEAHRFLVETIGCKHLYSEGPVSRDDDWMETKLGVHPRAVLRELQVFQCGEQAVLEVIEYEAPDQRTTQPRNSDVGGNHVALYVEDIDVAVEYLQNKGVTLLGEPLQGTGPTQGQRWVYFLAPWGMPFELVSYPNGRAFGRSPGNASDG